jgi:hypothetical protein
MFTLAQVWNEVTIPRRRDRAWRQLSCYHTRFVVLLGELEVIHRQTGLSPSSDLALRFFELLREWPEGTFFNIIEELEDVHEHCIEVGPVLDSLQALEIHLYRVAEIDEEEALRSAYPLEVVQYHLFPLITALRSIVVLLLEEERQGTF